MAVVIGTPTTDSTVPRLIVMRGTAELLPGDDSLSIDIPPENQAGPGKQSNVKFTVALRKKDNFVLRGTAVLVPGNESLSIAIPLDFQAPLGKEHITNSNVVMTYFFVSSVLSWNGLTQAQWNDLTQAQWNEMAQ